MKAWSIFMQTSGGARLWCALTERLVDRYVSADLHAYIVRHYDYHRIGGELLSIYRDIIEPAHEAVSCA